MKIKKIGKKGITIKFLIGLIILVLGFAILLFFYFQLGWTGRVDKEVCHQSVIYRATLPTFANAKEYVPLKCKTEKICITSGLLGGSCEEFKNSKGVVKVKVSNLEELNQFMAREMVDCWRMMGEGKVQVFGNFWVEDYGIGTLGSSCVICNRVAFDRDNLEKAGIDVEELNVMNYMQTHAIPGEEMSYYAYLAGQGGELAIEGGIEVGDINELASKAADTTLEKEFGIKKEDKKEIKEAIEKAEFEEIKSDELSVMFMQVTAPTHGDVLKNTLTAGLSFLGLSFAYKPGAFVGSKTVYNPIMRNSLGRFVKGSGAKVTKAAATPLLKIVAIAAVVAGVLQHVNVANNKYLSAGYCGDVSVGDDSRDGCSVVRIAPYDEESFSQYCTKIESIT